MAAAHGALCAGSLEDFFVSFKWLLAQLWAVKPESETGSAR